jgi:hypothetical protein
MKSYPLNKYVLAEEDVLIDYTIYPDLKFYEVNGDLFKTK